MLAQVVGEAVGELLGVVARRERAASLDDRARSASGVVRENRGSPEAGDHDSRVTSRQHGLSAAGMGRHDGDVGVERR